jgi:2'-hydroxyisoflavone reductase
VLKGHVGQYVFISTISVYAANDKPADETAALVAYQGADPMAETSESLNANPRLYGPLKAACETEARTQYGEAATTIIRPGLIVGPGDGTERFTYWPVRLARGGEMLAPGDGSDPVQFIDARDLAEWTIRIAEQRTIGVFNAGGPARAISMQQMLAEIAQGVHVDPNKDSNKVVWAPNSFLRQTTSRLGATCPCGYPARAKPSASTAVTSTAPSPTALPIAPCRSPPPTPWPGSAPCPPSGSPSSALASPRSANPSCWRS